MQIKKSRGFTIIELIVVIAIIAVLASIVLVNVTQYLNKGKNAAIKGNMSTMVTNSAVYFDANSALFGSSFIAATDYTVPDAATDSANGTGTMVKFGSTTTQAWCSCSPINTTTGSGAESGTYCVDSTGYKKVTATVCATRCLSAAAAFCAD